jgi:thioesterase domain-containing protein
MGSPAAMKGYGVMPDTSKLSETKQTLLEKYLHREITRAATTEPTEERPALPSSIYYQVPVIPIQTGGSKRPVFYLHVHVTGGAFYNFALAHDLGPDQPFYMLNPYMFDSKQMPPTLETMAETYIESLRTIQPEGPYLLVGFCGGGIIAFEMAQQLRAQGQAVALLILIEPRDGPAPHRLLFRKLLCGCFRSVGTLIGLGPDKQLEWFLRVRHVGLQLLKSPYKTQQSFSLVPPPAEALRQDWIGVFVWIISQYNTRQYPGKVTYFWAREEPKYLRTWWGKVAEAKELEVHLIPGTHTTCRTDHLHDLAEHLKACLSKVQVES